MLNSIIGHAEGGRIRLVAGAHRLAAAKKLGWSHITAMFIDGDDVRMRPAEISENLHRADLTALEHDQLTAEWVKLTELHSGQNVQNESKRVDGRGHRKEGGIANAARKLAVAGKTEEARRKNVERAVKVASLCPEAKQVAREVGLDDNRTVLLDAAKETTPERQVGFLKNRAAAHIKSKPARSPSAKACETTKNNSSSKPKPVPSLNSLNWAEVDPWVREKFVEGIGIANLFAACRSETKEAFLKKACLTQQKTLPPIPPQVSGDSYDIGAVVALIIERTGRLSRSPGARASFFAELRKEIDRVEQDLDQQD